MNGACPSVVDRLRERLPATVSCALRATAPPAVHIRREGRVLSVDGTVVRGRLPDSAVGMLCRIDVAGRRELAEVVGFDACEAILAPLGRIDGLSRGAAIVPLGVQHALRFRVSPLGVIFDGFGRTIGQVPGAIVSSPAAAVESVPAPWDVRDVRPVIDDAPDATTRPPVRAPLQTGVRAIDGLLTLGRGQRVGIFAPAGCGKTTLLGALARGTDADAVVLALVGERGRELREFIEHAIPPELATRCVVVCATSDRSALERSRAAFTATTIAEALRDKGKNVLLLVDSLTRFARAQRDVGLAAGEEISRGGLTPSVYAMLPRVIERAGNAVSGSITSIYTVLVEGDVRSDPLADEIKSLLDGHVVLSPDLADEGHFPAIDVLASLSRLQPALVDPDHLAAAARARSILAKYKEIEFLIRVGEYRPGHDPVGDHAIRTRPDVLRFLRQNTAVLEHYGETRTALLQLGT